MLCISLPLIFNLAFARIVRSETALIALARREGPEEKFLKHARSKYSLLNALRKSMIGVNSPGPEALIAHIEYFGCIMLRAQITRCSFDRISLIIEIKSEHGA